MHLLLYSGRRSHLRELRQTFVDGGILEGVPTREHNHRLVMSVVSDAARAFKVLPVLIEPDEQVLEEARAPGGILAKIPSVACVGRFLSFEPARDSKMQGSELVVAWFQDEFGLPEGPSLERLKRIDWDAAARDLEW